jgi:hypothetical protein
MDVSCTRLLVIALTTGLAAACQPPPSDSPAADPPAVQPSLPATGPEAGHSDAWLDATTVAGWNTVGMAIPVAPAGLDDADARCRESAREAESAEDELVAAAGWDLVGEVQREGPVAVVIGTAAYDGMCRPTAYQAFAFVDGAFAGTLAPEPMMSRTDAALGRVTVQQGGRLSAEYTRYAPDDALCCPSRITTVTFVVQDGLVQPESASTSSTSMEPQ